jgi:mRNA interferase MazF
MKEIKRGQIWYADLSPVVGSEQGGYRPILIIQNDIGNRYSPTIIGAVITSRHTKADLPTHIWLNAECGLPKESMVECEQVRTLDKKRLKEFMGTVSEEVMEEINKGLKISFALR